jgi:hypothetical protein
MAKTTLGSLSRQLTSEVDAYAYLEDLRWKGAPVCPHCNGRDVYFIQPKNGESRKTRTGAQSERRVWKCREKRCGKQFSVLTGTIFHGTKIPVRTWVLVFFDFMADKNGMSAREVERKYGMCPRSAWHMLHRIRAAMANDWSGIWENTTVLADEAYIGGEPKNRHANKRGHSRRGRGTEKMPVVSVLNDATGEVRSTVTARVDGWTLGQIVLGNAEPSGSILVTDTFKGYNLVGSYFSKHIMVNHHAGEYVRDGYTTNRVESYFSQLKRSIDGTHHHVTVKHLHRYTGEHDLRRSTCKMTDAERMAEVMGQVEGRLTYAALTGSA